jgi:hypothetical protein
MRTTCLMQHTFVYVLQAPKWGVVCDVYTYSTAIRCAAQGHEWQRAIQVMPIR